ncbi:hypothetical protein [Actinoplanes sp. NPDC049118]|uniref:hypothetical protein n=1 Tax=Actinoplanes sp. NPDC049118 TaxID=3155769 RepID=UPI0033F85FE0
MPGSPAQYSSASVSACNGGRPEAQTAPSTASTPGQPASAPPSLTSPPAAAASYKPPSKPCDLLDRPRLTAALGADAGDLIKPRVTDTDVIVFAACERLFGPATGRSVVSLQVQTLKTGTAQVYYDGLRPAQQKLTPIADVPQLGQGAYTYSYR